MKYTHVFVAITLSVSISVHSASAYDLLEIIKTTNVYLDIVSDGAKTPKHFGEDAFDSNWMHTNNTHTHHHDPHEEKENDENDSRKSREKDEVDDDSRILERSGI